MLGGACIDFAFEHRRVSPTERTPINNSANDDTGNIGADSSAHDNSIGNSAHDTDMGSNAYDSNIPE
jgi:hypothetical protein